MLIGVPAETAAGETRVAVTPETAKKLVAQGHVVRVQAGAGLRAAAIDEAYRTAGAEITDAAGALGAEMVLKVRSPAPAELAQIQPGSVLVGMLEPFNAEGLQRLAAASLTAFALEAAPRTTRAQSMDVLSSQANIAGYKAVIMAADRYQKFFPMLMTAAGTVKAARVVILGVGVAGLQAIATAKRLGAVIEASDVRPSVKEQVESLGAKFIDVPYETAEEKEAAEGVGGYARPMPQSWLERQKVEVAKRVAQADVVISTALIPGRAAPVLITEEMVQSMKPGSVIIDMAAGKGAPNADGTVGGNCPLTEADRTVVKHGVTIVGYTDLPSRLARQASTLYSSNLLRLTEDLCKTKDGVIDVNMDDEAIRGLTVIKEGAVTWPPPPPKLPAAAPAKPTAAAAVSAPAKKSGHGHGAGEPASARSVAIVFGVGALLFWLVGAYAPASFLAHFTVFVLACFVGYMVIWNVTPALHTPLMSVTNAISSIIAVGALIQVAPPLDAAGAEGRPGVLILALAVLALTLTAINMFGGFAVTRRMLAMFRK